jgi:hypothetical protein
MRPSLKETAVSEENRKHISSNKLIAPNVVAKSIQNPEAYDGVTLVLQGAGACSFDHCALSVMGLCTLDNVISQ